MPIVAVKLLSDSLKRIARGLSKVLGMVDEDDAEAAEELSNAGTAKFLQLSSHATIAENGRKRRIENGGIFRSQTKRYPNIVNFPPNDYKYYLGDNADLVFFSGDLREVLRE